MMTEDDHKALIQKFHDAVNEPDTRPRGISEFSFSFENTHYMLAPDGKTPVPATSPEAWLKMMDDESIRRVALSKPWKGEVSTVFLGFAAPGTEGDDKIPHLWETLVLDGAVAGNKVRSKTYDDAVVAHETVVADVKKIPWWVAIWFSLHDLVCESTFTIAMAAKGRWLGEPS
jgi:hypothetical protein